MTRKLVWRAVFRIPLQRLDKKTTKRKGEHLVRIFSRQVDQTTIFDVSGDITLANSPQLRKAVLREFRESRTPRVVLNLSQVRYIDSSAQASLVEGLKVSRDLGSRFVLFGLSPITRERLKFSQLLKLFEVYDSEEQALAS
jgi:anti-sigma B factor antagonist